MVVANKNVFFKKMEERVVGKESEFQEAENPEPVNNRQESS